MKTRTKIFIIAVCIVVLVAVFVSPTSALYYQEILLEAGFTSRSFNMDTENDDSLKLSLNTNATFNYGFFTETTEGSRNLIFKIDYDNVSYIGDVTSLDNASITFSKKVGNSWVPLSQNEDGDYYDSDPYSMGDKGLYSLSITNYGSEILRATIPVIITSIGKGDTPDTPIYVPMKEGGVELNQIDTIVIDSSIIAHYTKNNGSVEELKNFTITFGERTDDSSKIIAYAYDKNENIVSDFAFTFTNENKFDITFSNKSVNNGDHVSIEIYFPKSVPVTNVEILDFGSIDLSGIVAKNVVVKSVKKVGGNQYGSMDISYLTLDNLTVEEYYGSYSNRPSTTISNIKPLSNQSINSIDVSMRSGGDVSISAGAKIDTLTFRPVNSYSGTINFSLSDDVDTFNIDGVLAQTLDGEIANVSTLYIDTKGGEGLVDLEAKVINDVTIVKSNDSAKVTLDCDSIDTLTANMGTNSKLNIETEQSFKSFEIDCSYVNITCKNTDGGSIRSREGTITLKTWNNAVAVKGENPIVNVSTDFAESLSITGSDQEIIDQLKNYNIEKTITYTSFYYGTILNIEMDD